MLVAIPTPENMWQSILRNPVSGNTGNDGVGNGTGSSVANVFGNDGDGMAQGLA